MELKKLKGDLSAVRSSQIHTVEEPANEPRCFEQPFSVVRGGFSEGDPNTINVSFTSYANRPTIVS